MKQAIKIGWMFFGIVGFNPDALAQQEDLSDPPLIRAPIIRPVITGFSFTVGSTKTVMTISGENLSGTSSVSIAGVAVKTKITSTASQAVFVLPATAVNGVVSLKALAGTTQSLSPALLPPFVSSLSPSSGLPGSVLSLSGRNLRDTSEIRIGDSPLAQLTLTSALQISGALPLRVNSGAVSVISPGGTAAAGAFQVLAPPAPSSVILLHPQISPGNDPEPVLRVSGTVAGATVGLFRDPTCSLMSLAAQGVATGSSIELEADRLSDGHYQFYAAQNLGGHQSPCSTSFASYTADLTAPTVTGLANSSIPVRTRTFNWGCSEPGCTFRFLIDQSASSAPSGPFDNVVSTSFGSGSGTFFLHVQASDAVGNLSAVAHASFILDNTPPPLPASIVLANGLTSPGNNRTPTLRVHQGSNQGSNQGFAQGDTVFLHRVIGNLACANSNVIASGVVVQGMTAIELTTSTLEDGSHVFRASVRDSAGNVSGCSTASATYVLDTVPPAPPSITLSSASPSSNPRPQFLVSNLAAGVTVNLYTDQTCSGSIASADQVAQSSQITLTALTLSQGGTFIFRARAKDAAGNSTCGSASAAYTFTTGNPSQPSIIGFSPQGGSQGTVVTITGTGFQSGMSIRVGSSPVATQVVSTTIIQATLGSAVQSGPIQLLSSAGSVIASTDNTTLGAYGNGSFESLSPFVQACNPRINQAKSLAISTSAVRNDSCRTCWGTFCPNTCSEQIKSRWNFFWLMSQMKPANMSNMSTSRFIQRWLTRWRDTGVTNIWPHSPNAGADTLTNLIIAYDDPNNTDAPLSVAANQDDFRLVAILFRPDLDATSSTPSAGEGRFIFSLDNGATRGDEIILEYKLPVSMGVNPVSASQWYLRMARLSSLDFNSEQSRLRLQLLTDAFAAKNFTGVAGMTNGSGINQVRTNTIAREGGIWTLREFRLFDTEALPQNPLHQAFFGFFSQPSGPLGSHQLGELAHFTNHGSPGEADLAPPQAISQIQDFVAANANSFAQGTASLGNAESHLWGGKDNSHQTPGIPLPNNISAGARTGFKMTTCGGCHGGADTGASNRFLMVDGFIGSAEARLRPFMTGTGDGLISQLGLNFSKADFNSISLQPFSPSTGQRNDSYSDLHVRAKVLINQVMENFCDSSDPNATTIPASFLNF